MSVLEEGYIRRCAVVGLVVEVGTPSECFMSGIISAFLVEFKRRLGIGSVTVGGKTVSLGFLPVLMSLRKKRFRPKCGILLILH